MATKSPSKRTTHIHSVPSARRAKPTEKTAADLMQKIAEDMERMPPQTFEGIPTDVSKNVDHYLYGTPKRS